ncbi:hypothetical protein ACOMHN_011031 [Nucella lapillus]
MEGGDDREGLTTNQCGHWQCDMKHDDPQAISHCHWSAAIAKAKRRPDEYRSSSTDQGRGQNEGGDDREWLTTDQCSHWQCDMKHDDPQAISYCHWSAAIAKCQ